MGIGDKVHADEVVVGQRHFVTEIILTSIERIVAVIGAEFHSLSADYIVKSQHIGSAGSLKLWVLYSDFGQRLPLPLLLVEGARYQFERAAKSNCVGCEIEGHDAGAVRFGPVAAQIICAALAV